MTRRVKAVTGVDSDIYRHGFTLPTVLISSIILIAMLVLSVQMSTSAQSALRDQYYQQLAREAAEAGAEYASECVLSGIFTTTKDITPQTNCSGVDVPSNPRGVVDTGTIKSSFLIRIQKVDDKLSTVTVRGVVDLGGAGSGSVGLAKTSISHTLRQQVSLEMNVDKVRASQRWWGFGNNVQFDFNTAGSSDPEVRYRQSHAGEGSATISDGEGNLLFQTNGLTIWNRSGREMAGSSGLNGANSATQPVAAFPFDRSYRMIGVVSNNSVSEGIGAGELYLSVVDMDLDGGEGAVLANKKNIPLGGKGYANEGVGAMPSNVKGQFWVYTFNAVTNRITRFRVSSQGQISGQLAQTMSPGSYRCNTSRISYGSLTFSDDYSKLLLYSGAFGCSVKGGHSNGGEDSGRAYIYDTNPATGELTLRASWITRHASTEGSGYFADFSPQEKYVYVSRIYPGRITRYKIENLTGTVSVNSAAVKASEYRYPQSMSSAAYTETYYNTPDMQGGGQVRRASNGKMYIADHAYVMKSTPRPCRMNVINIPDHPHQAYTGLVVGGLTLPSGTCSTFGLPQMATAYEPRVMRY